MKRQIPEDARVFVTHLRRWPGRPKHYLNTRYGARVVGNTDKPLAKGGATLVQIELGNGRTVRGSARCSDLDNYDRGKGRMIATGRALAQLEAT